MSAKKKAPAKGRAPASVKKVPEHRPWPYLDIPRPPLLAGVDLISVPEAVGELGAKLYPDEWPDRDRPWKWRERWWSIRSGKVLACEEMILQGVVLDLEGNMLGTLSGELVPELPETARVRKLLFELDGFHDPKSADKPHRPTLFFGFHCLLAEGLVRALVTWEDPPDDRHALHVLHHAEVPRSFWLALSDGVLWGDVAQGFADMCWCSMLVYPGGTARVDSNIFRVYLLRSDVEAVGAKEIAEAVRAGRKSLAPTLDTFIDATPDLLPAKLRDLAIEHGLATRDGTGMVWKNGEPHAFKDLKNRVEYRCERRRNGGESTD
jgi:hypothetical protein